MKKAYWVLILVLGALIVWFATVMVGILWYVAAPATGGVTCQSKSNYFAVTGQTVSAGANGVRLDLRNGTGEAISITSAVGAGDFSGTGTVFGGQVPENGDFQVTGITGPASGKAFEGGRVKVNYSIEGTAADFEVVCVGRV